VLGKPASLSVTIPAAKPTTTTATTTPAPITWSVGDRVEVSVPFDVLRQLQENHGGFNPRMAEIMGKAGVVHRITNNGDVRDRFYEIPCRPKTSGISFKIQILENFPPKKIK
jgi:hypothetical protein